MSRWEKFQLPSSENDKGVLVFADYSKHLPFEPRRSFWVKDVPEGTSRGFHAHKTGHQVLICLQGRILAKFSDGLNSQEFELNGPESAVWMKNLVWGEQTFLEPNSVLLVLASNSYDESDYIRDRNEFNLLVQKIQ